MRVLRKSEKIKPLPTTRIRAPNVDGSSLRKSGSACIAKPGASSSRVERLFSACSSTGFFWHYDAVFPFAYVNNPAIRNATNANPATSSE